MDIDISKRLSEFTEIKDNIIKANEKKLDTINKYIEVLKNCNLNDKDSLETKIFKLYLVLNSTTDVADYLNNLGLRIKTESNKGFRKFLPIDITDVIRYQSVNVSDLDLREAVIKLQRNNSKGIGKKWFYG